MPERLNVNPNRMELLKLKRRLAVARRGHHLLKEKLDELMKPFLAMVKDVARLRSGLEAELVKAHGLFTLARSGMSPAQLEQALSYPRASTTVKVGSRPVVSVMAPDLSVEVTGGIDCYGLASTPALLDESLGYMEELLPELVEMAQQEKTVQMLAEEIEKTRRRVNALEYVLLPQLEESIRYITMKLDEFERSNLTRLMKIKQMTGRESTGLI